MNNRLSVFQKIAGWIVSILIPAVIIAIAVRLILTPLFLFVEYRTPNFPADPYGFTLTDRMKWSTVSWEYIVSNAGISLLADQRLADGTPLYNERELSHMVDAKNVVQGAFKAGIAALLLILAAGIWAWRGKWLPDWLKAISRGGWITVGLVVAILVGVMVNFSTLFTDFHKIFFTGDTWLFYYSNSLIRTFPLRFWQDCFIFAGVFSLAAGLVLGLVLRQKKAAQG